MTKYFALALVALSALAVARPAAAADPVQPQPNLLYRCWYESPTGYGTSQFVLERVRADFWRGTELFTFNGAADQRKVAFAKGVILQNGVSQWEFTINPGGPQCKDTRIYYQGAVIDFQQCSDGHRRTCYF